MYFEYIFKNLAIVNKVNKDYKVSNTNFPFPVQKAETDFLSANVAMLEVIESETVRKVSRSHRWNQIDQQCIESIYQEIKGIIIVAFACIAGGRGSIPATNKAANLS